MLAVMEDARVQAADAHAAWSESFNQLFAQVAGVFGNANVRAHGRGYLLGLLSHAERKNSWWLAELAGDVSPDGMQRLLLNYSPWELAGHTRFPTPEPVAIGAPARLSASVAGADLGARSDSHRTGPGRIRRVRP